MKPAKKPRTNKIDELKRHLAETEARFNALTETFPIAVGISTKDGKYLYTNNTYFRVFGYTLDEINQLNAADLYSNPDDRLKWREFLQAQGSVKDFEVLLKRKDGTTFWAEISVLPIELAGEQAYIGSVIDISERKRIQAELQQSETRRLVTEAMQSERQRFFAVLETLPVMVCLLTQDYHVAFTNRAFRDNFGEANGRYCYQYRFDKEQPCDFCESFKVLKTGQPHHWEITRPDGKVIDVYDAPFTDVDGTPMILEMDVDITDRKKSEQELKGDQQRLEEMVNERTTRLEAEIEERIQLEEALQKNEAMLRAVLNQMPSGVTVRDAKTGELILANQQSHEIMGKLADNISQFTTYKGLHPDGRPYELDEWPVSRSIATGETVDSEEIECERSDGTHIILSMSSAPVRDDKGEIISGVGIFHDITARKHAEEHQAYLASFPENNPRPITEVTLKGKINYINPIAKQLFPDLPKLGLRHPWFSDWDALVHQINQDKAQGTVRDVLVGNRYYQQAFYFNEKQGLIRIYGLDITNLKQAEQALQLSEERYRTIVEMATEGIVLARPTGEYIYINQQMANMLGYQVDEMLGKSGTDFMYGSQQSRVQQLRHSLQNGELLHGEFKFRRKDGTELWSEYTASPVFNDQGEHVFNLAMHTDVTERRQANQALRQAHDELEKRVQERTQELFVANNQLRAEVAEREKAQEELETSVQELQVVEEELRTNNEMLLDAQKVLDSERQRYQDLFEFAPDAYLVTDKNGRILEANQYTTKMLNIQHHRLIRKPLIVFVAPADHGSFVQLISSQAFEREVQSQELRLTPRNGEPIVASVKVQRADEESGNYSLRWTIRDITLRKHAEETIHKNALRNAVLSEVSSSLTDASLDETAILDVIAKTTARLVGDGCIITLVSADGNWLEPVAISHKNPEVLDMMSREYATTHNSVRDGLFGRVFQSSKSLLIKELSPENATASVPPQYSLYLDAVGISSLLVVPIRLAEKTIGTLAIMRDKENQPYTEEDQSMLEILASRTGQAIHNAHLYQELQAALRKEVETHDQLVQSEKFAAVGRLLASITHEINNPLQTIKNCLYLSQLDTPPGSPMADALSIATAETNRLSDLVAQLREIYRPPTQGLNKLVSLPTIINEVQVLLASYLQDKHVQWDVTPPQDDRFSQLRVEGVPDQIKQVFLNISLNAIDAMEQKGGIIKIDFMVNAEANQVGVSFQDTGPGLPPEVKAKLFEPFITTKEKGLGLGLVICYDIIQRHNGRIDVESEAGQGASFTIWLPAKRE